MTLILNVAQGKGAPRPVVWLMRQAGRYLPEYRAIREKNNTLTMFRTPSIAAEITLQPLRRFPLDGAIVYADILLLPDALGLGLSFQPGEGPRFQNPIATEAQVAQLELEAQNPAAVIDRIGYVMETLGRVKPHLDSHQTLLGFAGAPWTVAAYMLEGGSAKGQFFQSKKLLYTQPQWVHRLLQCLTGLTIHYLKAQVQAGAQVVQLFESWGGALTPQQYATFALPYAHQILTALENTGVPTIHFVGEAGGIWQQALTAPSAVYAVDWRTPLDVVKAHPLAQAKALQGNLDPMALFATPDELKKHVETTLSQGQNHKGGFIFNLGHGINQHTPWEHVGRLVNWVQGWKSL